MATHNAPGQMLGYLYQVCFALNLLMESDDPSYHDAFEKLKMVASTSPNQANLSFYHKFNSMNA